MENGKLKLENAKRPWANLAFGPGFIQFSFFNFHFSIFIFVFFLAASPAYPQEFQGATVSAIRFETDVPYDTSELAEVISVKVAEPLSLRGVQDSVEALYGTGDFRDIIIDAARSGVDVVLTFRLSIHFRIGEIVLEGFAGQKQRAQKETKIRRGGVLSLDAVDRSSVAIQEMLRRRGFLEAVVDPETTFLREQNRADVIFHASLGPQAKIGAIQLEGTLAPFTEAELIKAMDRKIGADYRTDRARSDGEKLKRFLVNKGRRKADVRFLDAPYDPATDSVRMRYRVNVGPKVRVEVAGVARDRVRKWIPFRKNEGHSGDAMERASDRIITEFQRRGHFFVAVDVEEKTVADELVITYKIEPGPRYKLGEIDFEGNVKVSDDKLRDAISTSPSGWFRSVIASLWRRGTGVTQEQLNDDRDTVEAYYRLDGFTDVRVGQPVAKGNPDGTLAIRFPVVEGPQTLVENVIIEGNEKVPTDRLPEPLLVAGKPLNPQLLFQDKVALQTYYADRGYVEVAVAHHIDFTPDKTGATVRYRLAEGPRVRVDEVLVQGNTYTDREVILKKSRLRTGDFFSYRTLLEGQRNLYRLGIFQRVDISDQGAGTATAERDVIVQVDEGRNLTVSGSVFYSEEEGVGGSVAVSHRNLFGTARYAGVDALYADKRWRFAMSYQEPFIFGHDIPTQLTVFGGEEFRQPGDAHVLFRRLGTFVEASRLVREQTEWSVRYEYRIVECVIEDPTDPKDLCTAAREILPIPGLPREDQEIQISSVTPIFFWDRRNDLINPTRGFFASASAEYAFPLFRAETNFAKGLVQSAWYRPFTERSQIAISGRLGVIEPMKDEGEPGSVIPFAERFTAGGETTHRAFETDTLGVFCPPDPDDPTRPEEGCTPTLVRREDGSIVAVGGRALALLSVEYRFPVFGQLRGALFVDGGNVFGEAGDLFNVGEFRYGAGAGLRYLTPIGPVRLDIGFKLDRQPGEELYATFFSLGFPF